jgi:hypothetical protein
MIGFHAYPTGKLLDMIGFHAYPTGKLLDMIGFHAYLTGKLLDMTGFHAYPTGKLLDIRSIAPPLIDRDGPAHAPPLARHSIAPLFSMRLLRRPSNWVLNAPAVFNPPPHTHTLFRRLRPLLLRPHYFRGHVCVRGRIYC